MKHITFNLYPPDFRCCDSILFAVVALRCTVCHITFVEIPLGEHELLGARASERTSEHACQANHENFEIERQREMQSEREIENDRAKLLMHCLQEKKCTINLMARTKNVIILCISNRITILPSVYACLPGKRIRIIRTQMKQKKNRILCSLNNFQFENYSCVCN